VGDVAEDSQIEDNESGISSSRTIGNSGQKSWDDRCKGQSLYWEVAAELTVLSVGVPVRPPLLATAKAGLGSGTGDSGCDDMLGAGVTVGAAAAAGYEQKRSVTRQLLQWGRVSSHLMCRRLHSQHPLRDFRWARRKGLPIPREREPLASSVSEDRVGALEFLGLD
jgi:hypothetical protein